MTNITNRQETFIKTDKNREQILKEYNYACFNCKEVKKEKDDLDVYILDINKKPHTILPLCKFGGINISGQYGSIEIDEIDFIPFESTKKGKEK